jgi:hypothetical protein
MQSQEDTMISIDQGRSAIKIAHPTGRVEWPPLVARLNRPPQAALLEVGPERGAVLSLDGVWWAVGEPARGLPQATYATDERKATDVARVVVAAAPAVIGAHRWSRVSIALAVPAGLAASDAWPLARRVVGPIAVLLADDTRLAPVVDPHVLPEPAAAAMGVILDSDGRPDRALLEGAVAIVDAGHRTVDIAVLRRGRLVEGSPRSTPSGGILAHDRWAREALEPQVGLLTDSERAAVVGMVAAGRVPVLRGREVSASVMAQVERYRRWLAERVVADVRSLLAAVEHDTLILTGGLAGWLEPELRAEWPHARIPQEPRWSVVVGGLRYLAYMAIRRAETSARATT